MQPIAEIDHHTAMRREVTVLCLIFMLYSVVNGLAGGVLTLLGMEAAAGSTVTNIHADRLMLLAYLGTYILMFAAPLGIFFLVRSQDRVTDYFYIDRGPKLGVALLGCFGVLAVNYVCAILSDAGSLIFARVGVLADAAEWLSFGEDAVSNILYFVILVIAPAVLEEFCFRGVICGRLAQYNRTAAVILSSILFSLMHMTVDQIPFAFAAGLLMGYVYLRTGSIWSSVLIHAVNNGFAYFSEYLYYRYDGAMEMQRMYMLGWAALFVIGLTALVVLGLSHKEADVPTPLSGGRAMAASLTSPLFIVCCSLALAATVLTVPLL